MTDRCELSPYSDLVDILDALHLLVRETRRSRRLTMGDVERTTGVSASTICRLEAGAGVSLANAAALLRWLAADTLGDRGQT